MIEIDGPASAYFETSEPYRYVYETHALLCRHAGDLVQRYESWRTGYNDENMILVWRARPTIDGFTDDNGEYVWKLRFRCTKIPKVFTGSVPVKPEGAEIERI